MLKLKKCIVICIVLAMNSAFAWSGTDSETGNSIDVEEGNTVRSGNTIDYYYDYNEGEYHSFEVDSVRSSSFGTEIDGYDSETGEYKTLDMD